LEDGELMPESEDLRLELEARPSEGPEGGEQGDEQRGHGPADGISRRLAIATTTTGTGFLIGTAQRRDER
jgi:hypothetical protein